MGLLTVAFRLRSEGVPAYYNPSCGYYLKQLSLQAARQVQTMGKFGRPVIIFMDDRLSIVGRYDRIGVIRERYKPNHQNSRPFVVNMVGWLAFILVLTSTVAVIGDELDITV